MSLSIILLNATLLFSILVSSTIVFFTWQRRNLAGARPFFFLIISITIWSISLLFQINANGFDVKLFWEKVIYTNISIIPPTWILFTYQYTNPDRSLLTRFQLGLVVHPLLNFFLIWIFKFDELLWYSSVLDQTQTFLTTKFAIWTQASIVYTNIVMLIGVLFLVNAFARTPRFYSRQVLSLFGAFFLPWVTNALFILKVFPFFNPTPVTISISGVIIFWGYFKMGLFDLIPIARASVIEGLKVGVIALDLQNRIVDINPEAQSIISQPKQDLIGLSLGEIFAPGFSLLTKWIEQPFTQENLAISKGVIEHHYACQISDLIDSRGRINGRIFTLNDITEQDQTEMSLRKYTQRLEFLYDSGQAILNAQEPEQIAAVTLEYIRRLIPCQLANIVLFSYDTQESILLAINPDEQSESDLSKRPFNEFSGLSQLKSGQIVQINLNSTPVVTQTLHQINAQDTEFVIKVPLLAQNELIGSLNIFVDPVETLTEEHIVILREVSITLAVALQQANLYASERSQRELAQTFHEVGQALTSSLDLKHVLEIILDELAKVVFYDNASIMLLDKNILKNVAYRTIHQGKQSLKAFNINEFKHLDEVIKTKSPVIISNTKSDPRWKTLPTTTSIHSWLGVPLKQNDQIIGLLNITKAEENFYHARDSSTALMLAMQAVTAIENAQLFESERHTRKQEEILRAANIALTENLELDKILDKILELLSQLVNYDSANVMLIEKDEEVVIYALRGYENWTDASETKAHRFHLMETPNLYWLFENRQGFIIPDTSQFEGWNHVDHVEHVKNWMGIPLIANAKVIGFFSIDKKQPHFFTNTDLHTANALAAQAAIAIQNAKLFYESQQKTGELEALAKLSNSLRHTNDVAAMVDIILKQATAVIKNSWGSIYLTDEDSHTLQLTTSYPQTDKPDFTNPIPIGEGAIGQAAQTGQPFIFTHLPLPSVRQNKEKTTDYLKTITLPLSTQELTVGVMNITVPKATMFGASEQQLLNAFAEIGASAIHRVLVLDTLEQRVTKRTQELAQANVRLQDLDQLKSKFIADVSHELRTPITNLRLYLDLFARVSQEKQQHYLTVLQQQTKRLAALVEDILTLSKLEAKKQKTKLEDVAIHEIVEHAIESLLTQINQAEFEIQVDFDPHLPTIRASTNQMTQVMTNLLSNAINYSKQGPIIVKTSLEPLNQIIVLRIQDNGAGIEADDLPYIFDRFYRGKQAGQSAIPGTGLGLAIVKEIVESHYGSIEVQSSAAEGSCFIVRFPV